MGINRSGKFEELFRELSHELNNHNIIDNSSMIIKDKTACNSASPVWKKIFDKVFERQKVLIYSFDYYLPITYFIVSTIIWRSFSCLFHG